MLLNGQKTAFLWKGHCNTSRILIAPSPFFAVVMINDKAKRSLCASQSYYQVKWQRYIGGNIASKLFYFEIYEEFSCLKTNFAVIFPFSIQGKLEQNFSNFHVLVLFLSEIRLNMLFSPIIKIPWLPYSTKPSLS